MKRDTGIEAERRRFLRRCGALPLAWALPAWAGRDDTSLVPTPACSNEGGATPPQTEGPFFKAPSPERVSLIEPGLAGTRIVLAGAVLDTRCRPLPGVRLEFWQADETGRYDNAGFRLRGHQFTDRFGRYRLETIVPGRYPGRTRHIHVKLGPPGAPPLTTQLYFPGEAGNQADALFDPRLLTALERTLPEQPERWAARFQFVLAAA